MPRAEREPRDIKAAGPSRRGGRAGRASAPRPPREIPAEPPGLDLLLAWFARQGWTPWPFQRRAWSAYAEGRSGLINVPTGAGKTYAAYIAPLAGLIDEAREARPAGLRILYITPLRAVSRDIQAALELPIAALGLPFRVESRTGDTSGSVRARQRKELPHVLVTTPESLSLLLTQDAAPGIFANLRAVIVDEWHELLSSKRGTQVELALARLRRFAPSVRTWALSATLANLDEAAQAVVGVGGVPAIIRGTIERPVIIETLLPSNLDAFPWAGFSGLSMVPDLLRRLDPSRSTLIFTNTRSQAERWYQSLRGARPEWEPLMALHHGSLDRDERERVEAGLKSGEIRLVVATSSLDLGVDFAPVERVVQVGSPKGVARLVQRAGRAAHRPGAPCHILCVPTHAMELLEVAAVRRAIAEGRVEPRLPLGKPLDVLAQHLVTCALGGGFDPGELYGEVRSAWSYRTLTREEFEWALSLMREGGGTLRAYAHYHRVKLEPTGRGPLYRVPDKRIAQLHRLNVGTITADATLDLRYTSGRSLGSIEEYFVSNLSPGDVFVFAGKTLEFVALHDLTAYVRNAPRRRTTLTPRWSGTRLPISEELSQLVREALQATRDGALDHPEQRAAATLVRTQARVSHVPAADELLAEVWTDRDGHHLFLYPFEGRLVHGGLAAILALRLTRARKATLATAANDYGLELLCPEPFPFADLLTPALFARENVVRDALDSVNMGELAKRQFREIARVSGMVFQAYPGARKSGRQLHASASLLYDVLAEFDPGNLLLEQARREVLDRQFEETRLARTLDRLAASALVVREVRRPTPLALPLLVERVGARLSSESILDRIERMKRSWSDDHPVTEDEPEWTLTPHAPAGRGKGDSSGSRARTRSRRWRRPRI